jgi:hypothetical protein
VGSTLDFNKHYTSKHGTLEAKILQKRTDSKILKDNKNTRFKTEVK